MQGIKTDINDFRGRLSIQIIEAKRLRDHSAGATGTCVCNIKVINDSTGEQVSSWAMDPTRGAKLASAAQFMASTPGGYSSEDKLQVGTVGGILKSTRVVGRVAVAVIYSDYGLAHSHGRCALMNQHTEMCCVCYILHICILPQSPISNCSLTIFIHAILLSVMQPRLSSCVLAADGWRELLD
jgi:hypothetical protein